MENSLENKKPSLAFKILKKILVFLFPGAKILSTNKFLKICGEIDTIANAKGKQIPHPYYARQRTINWVVSVLASLPLFLGLFSGYAYMSSSPIFPKAKTASINQLKKLNVVEAIKKISIAKKIDPNLGKDFQIGLWIMASGAFFSIIIGGILLKNHVLIRDSELLKKSLMDQGIIRKDEEKESLVLATRAGYLVRLTANTPKEVEDNQRIWMSLNTKVRGYSQHPTELSLVFFKNAYQLKKGGDYGFNSK